MWFRRPTPPPAGMADWGPLGYLTLQAGHVQQPDHRTHVPRTMFGSRAKWPGLQLRNGVGQLCPLVEVRTADGVPFWQQSPLRNPQRYTRFGGGAQTPIVPAVQQAARQDYYAGQDVDGSGSPAPLGRLTRITK